MERVASLPAFSFSACIARMLFLYRRDWKRILVTSWAAWIAIDLVLIFLGDSGATAGTGIGVTLLGACFVLWVGDEYRAASRDEQAAMGKLRIGALIGTSVFVSLATLMGLALLVVPGLVIGTLWSLHQPVIVRERKGFGASLVRSRALVQRHVLGALGCWMAVFLVVIGAGVATEAIAQLLGGPDGLNDYGWQSILGDLLLFAPVFPILPLTAAAMYDLTWVPEA